MTQIYETGNITPSTGFRSTIFSTYRSNIIDWSYSEDPNRRYWAVLSSGFETVDVLERLTQDECWLVRHGAKRLLNILALVRAINYGENGLGWTQDDLWSMHVWGISDIVYELYLEDWKHAHSTYQSRMDDIRNWGRNIGDLRGCTQIPDRYEDWVRFGDSLIPPHLDYDSFCGYNQPDCLGLYHNRAYVAKLLDNDKELLAKYDADINDGPMRTSNINDILGRAVMVAKHSELDMPTIGYETGRPEKS